MTDGSTPAADPKLQPTVVTNAYGVPCLAIPIGVPLKSATALYFSFVMDQVKQNRTHAAKALGMTRASVYARLENKAISAGGE